ncbi:structural maintenance of chromosomes protein 2-2 [Trichonephila clavipes]|nr:structural maintenance of chromosomes protein 2-2 [Trichonephila clavipes]
MHIKSIVLEGFKSYGTRQEIHGFDPEFNAITGLNGSGKSNILDSICFVLGIQNLQQVRATNLTELVYKNGQAGINKAVVSITFDNRDPHTAPLGYLNQKEIVVTRTESPHPWRQTGKSAKRKRNGAKQTRQR